MVEIKPLKESPKKLYDNFGRHWKTLKFHKTPLSKLFSSVRQIDIFKNKEHHPKDENDKEIFISINGEKTAYFYGTMTPEFHEWIRRNTFVYPRVAIEIIQQRTHDLKTKKTKWHNRFLVIVEETSILGSTWLDYKTKKEIEQFFGVKL